MSFIVSGIGVTSTRMPARSITAREPLPPGSIPRKNSRSPISHFLCQCWLRVDYPACLFVLLFDEDVIFASEHHRLHSAQRALNLRLLAAEWPVNPAGFAGELRDHRANARFLAWVMFRSRIVFRLLISSFIANASSVIFMAPSAKWLLF